MMLRSAQDAYEALYTGKSYQHEIGLVDAVLDSRLGKVKAADAKVVRKVLEIGCGPGLRMAVLQQWHGKYLPSGLDRDPAMLKLAAKRVPGLPLHLGDMRDFTIDERYDGVLCLFGVIGYLENVTEMTKALKRMRMHLAPRGVLLLEPWLTPDLVRDGYLQASKAKREGLEVARMNYTTVVGNKSRIDIHYLIGDEGGVRHLRSQRELTLFTDAQYRQALRAAGFGDVELEAYGPQGRGLYVAQV